MATTYRFLPWARRGLAAALPAPSSAAPGTLPPLTARPTVDVTVSVSGGVGDVTTSALLHGPGDVVGIDPRQVIRCTPLPGTTSAEPNYLVAVDFDAPELPWLFTPIGAPSDQHLPPWIVLVVVEAREGVTLTPAAPLPRLTISSGAAAELPDLDDSWAWAHVQLLHSDALAGDPTAIAAGLAAAPDRNVSRLLSPRRLEANKQWIAAVVPAFDVGVQRGLGAEPKADATASHAWSSPDSIVLPVYHHWEFATGPEGDFESLARRIKPYEASLRMGLVPMFVGDGAPPLRVPAHDPQVLDMDGALRAPAGGDGRLDEVPDALANGLQEVTRTLADAADGVIDGHVLETADRQPVGPPVLASAHVRRWQVKDGDAQWFREVNLDPRPRVSAGLGAEVVRENQEDIANAAWRQVGDVLAAEAALQRAALTAWAANSFHGRHIAPMPDDRLLELTAPMAARVPMAGTSMTMAVQRSSLPDAVLDAGMRRALAPAGRAVARAAHRVGVPAGKVRPGIVARLAKGTLDVDPTLFERPAITGLAKDALEAPGATVVSALGLTARLPDTALADLTATAKALSGEVAPQVRDRIVLRPDLDRTGMLGQAHVDAARLLSADVAGVVAPAVRGGAAIDTSTVLAASAASILDDVLVAAPTAAGKAGVGLLVEAPAVDAATGVLTRAGGVTVDALDLDRGGRLVVRTQAGQANIPIADLHPDLAGTDLAGVLSRLPAGALARPDAGDAADAALPVVALGRVGGPDAGTPGGTVAAAVRGAPVRVLRGPARGALGAAGRADLTSRGDRPSRGDLPSRGGLPTRGDLPSRGGLPSPSGDGPIVDPGPEVPPVVVGTPVVTHPHGGRDGGDAPDGGTSTTVVMPPLIVDPGTLGRLATAVGLQATSTLLTVAPPQATFVAFDVGSAMTTVREHAEPKRAQALRRDALIALADRPVGQLVGAPAGVDGWWATHEIDRIMAYPTFPVPAYELLARYDRTRFCPGVDEVPPESVTLLETNPRFIASFMVGLNHETNRELLWRGYPTDSRGTPFRHFWARLDGSADIDPIHGWRTGSLAEQTTDPRGNLVLLLRGDLLRRYPNTIVVAMPATSPSEPDRDPAKLVHPIFAGRFDPDVSFYGFPLQDTDLTSGQGYFFALMEPVTEPRFGLDETDRPSDPAPADWSGVGWGDTRVEAGAHLKPSDLAALHVAPMPNAGDGFAQALFQHPFALYVHARHLVTPLPAQK